MNNQTLLKKIANARRIVEFDSTKPVSDENWQTLLSVAQSAASSNGLEPWTLLQIDDRDLREKIAKDSPGMVKQLASAPKFIIFKKRKLTTDYKKHLMRAVHDMNEATYLKFQASFQALTHLLLDIDETAWLERQASIPLGQMLFAASLLDIDCCPMEGFFYKKVGKLLAKEGLLDLKTEQLGVAVAFGYRKENPERPKTRRPLEEILTVI
ncbi:MAG: nitroreductase family protein [Streptococcaceae bacterium]|jgi:nitroreductase|nr:nitroreductase family protein [Streptococcaceae bacterium]